MSSARLDISSQADGAIKPMPTDPVERLALEKASRLGVLQLFLHWLHNEYPHILEDEQRALHACIGDHVFSLGSMMVAPDQEALASYHILFGEMLGRGASVEELERASRQFTALGFELAGEVHAAVAMRVRTALETRRRDILLTEPLSILKRQQGPKWPWSYAFRMARRCWSGVRIHSQPVVAAVAGR